jgi:hypothetical protein
MSLIHYVRPFLELGICKESCMARKTNETATTNRRKKTQVPDPTAAAQTTSDVQPAVHAQVGTEPSRYEEVRKDIPRSGTVANHVPVDLASENINIEDLIRRRAYELYLHRRATAGAGSGDENQDWLLAEREIRSRQGGGQKQFFAAAGGRA